MATGNKENIIYWEDFAKQYLMPLSMLKHLIEYRQTIGFGHCVHEIGDKIYLDFEKTSKYLAEGCLDEA